QPVVLDPHILTIDVAGFVETLTERSGTARIGRPAVDEADHRHRRLLRPRRQRTCCRRTAEHDELAPSHGAHPRPGSRPSIAGQARASQQKRAAHVRSGSFTSLWLLRSTVRMSASHPKATESLRSSEMTLSATSGPEQVQQTEQAYSITSSAMASTPGGMARPSALAVPRLSTSSNLLDWKTGKSAGFAPLRICPA